MKHLLWMASGGVTVLFISVITVVAFKQPLAQLLQTAPQNQTSQVDSPTNSALLTTVSVPEEAKQVLREMKRLNSRLEISITQLEYAQAIAEVKFTIEQFLESRNANNFPEFSKHLASSLEGHQLALEYWEVCEGGSCLVTEPGQRGDIIKKKPGGVVRRVFEKYPELENDPDVFEDFYSELPLTMGEKLGENQRRWMTMKLLPKIWQHTDEDTAQASVAIGE